MTSRATPTTRATASTRPGSTASTTATNGSQVGYDVAPFAEKTIVHGGLQSMPLKYDNTAAAELLRGRADLRSAPGLDAAWHHDPRRVLPRAGDQHAGPAVREDQRHEGAPSATTPPRRCPLWRQWAIPLAATGANLKSVKSLTIGVEGSGTGTLFIDDIRLYAVAPQAVSSRRPGHDRPGRPLHDGRKRPGHFRQELPRHHQRHDQL